MIKVKICGLTDEISVDTAVAAGADWIGFNFFPPSPRFAAPARAAALSARHQGGPKRVGLFVKPSEDEIAAVLDVLPLDILQLYVPQPRAMELRARFGLPVWRAVGVERPADLPLTAEEDGLLVEAKPPAGATRPGGNAVSFDWTILAGWQAPAPWLLAGGLTPDNVAQAIRVSGAAAVDVSSGVESSTGVKDPALIRQFIANSRL